MGVKILPALVPSAFGSPEKAAGVSPVPPAPPSCSSALLYVATEMLREAGGCSCPSFGVQKAPAERAARACTCHIVPSHVLPPPMLSGGSLSHHRYFTWLSQGVFLPSAVSGSHQCSGRSSRKIPPSSVKHGARGQGEWGAWSRAQGLGLPLHRTPWGRASPSRPPRCWKAANWCHQQVSEKIRAKQGRQRDGNN